MIYWINQAAGGQRDGAGRQQQPAESLRHRGGRGGPGGGADHHARLHSLQQDIPRVLADSSQLQMEPGRHLIDMRKLKLNARAVSTISISGVSMRFGQKDAPPVLKSN